MAPITNPTIVVEKVAATPTPKAPGTSGPAPVRGRWRLPPSRDDDLLVRVELHGVTPVGLEIAEERALGAAEREERHGRRHADVHAEHARLDAIAVLARPPAAAREDAGGVAELV